MKVSRYRIRKGSFLDNVLSLLAIMAMIAITGLGNHFIDGL